MRGLGCKAIPLHQMCSRVACGHDPRRYILWLHLHCSVMISGHFSIPLTNRQKYQPPNHRWAKIRSCLSDPSRPQLPVSLLWSHTGTTCVSSSSLLNYSLGSFPHLENVLFSVKHSLAFCMQAIEWAGKSRRMCIEKTQCSPLAMWEDWHIIMFRNNNCTSSTSTTYLINV